ncbi:streptomycin 3'-adenylyltransferase [Bacillus tianshenii]|uniref:Spectinomycin 9-adenylyltransferase n=1 Tax=Sutcliffiella tianshenii TaxID=1463404 RepID=A0ABS2P3L6_9BACI|nr:streptomycin 3'-adenylyltransferase [Bacillus tianshenii]
MEFKKYLQEIGQVFIDELEDNLIGIYIHGSIAMGCFNPNRSDVDLLVVVNEDIGDDVKRRMIYRLLSITQGHKNPLEMSIIQEQYLKDFIYPTPFELHFFHPRYLIDDQFICGGEGFRDPDLAAHIVVTYNRGATFYGKDVKKTFHPIDTSYYIESIVQDVGDAKTGIVENPVYYVLNLCRVLYFLKEGVVSSKKEAGEWGVESSSYSKLISECLASYEGKTDEPFFINNELFKFADLMLEEINSLKSMQHSHDN